MTPTQVTECTDEKQMCDWISVEDKMPEDGELVMIVAERSYNDREGCDVMQHITVGSNHKGDDCSWRVGNDYLNWDFDFNADCIVTHWMPLPEPPRAALNEVGYTLGMSAPKYERAADSIVYLRVQGYLTMSACDAARKKLMKDIAKEARELQ